MFWFYIWFMTEIILCVGCYLSYLGCNAAAGVTSILSFFQIRSHGWQKKKLLVTTINSRLVLLYLYEFIQSCLREAVRTFLSLSRTPESPKTRKQKKKLYRIWCINMACVAITAVHDSARLVFGGFTCLWYIWPTKHKPFIIELTAVWYIYVFIVIQLIIQQKYQTEIETEGQAWEKKHSRIESSFGRAISVTRRKKNVARHTRKKESLRLYFWHLQL